MTIWGNPFESVFSDGFFQMILLWIKDFLKESF